MSAYADATVAGVQAMKDGASDFIGQAIHSAYIY